MSLFRRDSAGGKSPLPPRPPFVSRASGPSSASGKAPRPTPPPYPMSKEVLASGMVVRDKWKRDVFNELMLEFQRERSEETDQTAEAEGMPRQQNEQVLFPGISTMFLSDSCLLVIWSLGDRILAFLGIFGEDFGYWSL